MRSVTLAFRFLSLLAVLGVALVLPARADSVTPLVSTGWLKQHLQDPDVFVLDVRSAIDGGAPSVCLTMETGARSACTWSAGRRR